MRTGRPRCSTTAWAGTPTRWRPCGPPHTPSIPGSRTWTLPELVEAAVREHDYELARDALARLIAATQPAGNDLALGLEARCRALVSTGTAAEELYREAIDRLARTRQRPELARAHLLYGEWLRREGRRTDSRRSCGPPTTC